MQILAKNYSQREYLDNYIKNELGDNIDTNRTAGHTIEGSIDDLKRLNLSVSTRIYGVKVILQEEN